MIQFWVCNHFLNHNVKAWIFYPESSWLKIYTCMFPGKHVKMYKTIILYLLFVINIEEFIYFIIFLFFYSFIYSIIFAETVKNVYWVHSGFNND